MRSLIIRFLRVGLRTANPCLPLFILLVGLFFPALASAVMPMVAADLWHTVALKSDGTVAAWGYNGAGQLGDGTSTDRLSPVVVPGLTGVVAVAAGSWHTVALKSDGTVAACGRNAQGQLGDGTGMDRLSPVVVPGLSGVVAVAAGAGAGHTVALKSDGTVVAWGSNNFGELGDGTTAQRLSPVAVPGLAGVVAVTASSSHTVAIKSDGTVVTWGDNTYGQLGDGTTIQRNSPVAVPGLTGVVAVAASGNYIPALIGRSHTVALKSDGTVVAWGSNQYGELGDGTTTQRLSPIVVPGLNGVVAVAVGDGHTVALKSDGTVWTWGYNGAGQLGDGTATNRSTPVAVPGLTDVVAVAAGQYYTVALKSDGTVVMWGSNNFGQLGDGTTTNRPSPVVVPGLKLKSQTIGVASYIPYAAGNQWSYQNNNLATETVTMGSPVVLSSGVTAIPATTINSSEAGYSTTYSIIDSNGFRRYQEYYSSVPVPGYGNTSATATFSPAIILAPANVTVGSTYTSSGTASMTYTNVTTATLSYSSSTQVVGFETVTNYSGTQSWPALKAITSVTVSGTVNGQSISQASSQTNWLVAGIGAVQMYSPNLSGVMETWKLTSTNVTPPPVVTPTGGAILNLAPSWNLVGNSVNAPLDVAIAFGDTTKVTTVWKWIPATSKWAFYTPSMTAPNLATYATGKGYDVLTTINGGEGFWVNANADSTVQLPVGTAVTTGSFRDQIDPAQNKLLKGWNLVAVGDNPTSSVFNNNIGVAPPATGTIPPNLTTLWAWNNAAASWYFYAPSLDANGTLGSYIITKNYLNFGAKPLDPTTGFWVNKP